MNSYTDLGSISSKEPLGGAPYPQHGQKNSFKLIIECQSDLREQMQLKREAVPHHQPTEKARLHMVVV